MKKLLCLLLALAILFSFSACQSDDRDADRDDDEKTEERNEKEEKEEDEEEDEEADEEDGETELNVTEPATTEPGETAPPEDEAPHPACLLEIMDGNGPSGIHFDPAAIDRICVIFFWGTWCAPSIEMMSQMDALARMYRDSVTVIGVHSNIMQETASDYIATAYPDSPIWFALEDQSVDGRFGAFYQAMGGNGTYPYTLILDEKGDVVTTFSAMPSLSDLEAQIEALDTAPAAADFHVSVTDAMYKHLDSSYSSAYWCNCLHLPEITCNGALLENVNALLREEYENAFSDQYSEYVGLTYTWAQKDHLLSLMVRTQLNVNDIVSYHVYNIDLRYDQLMTDRDFYALTDLTVEESRAQITAILQNYCDRQTPNEYVSQEAIDYVISSTMSEENINNVQPFLSSEGEVCYVVDLGVAAGSGWIQVLYQADGNTYPFHVEDHKNCQ